MADLETKVKISGDTSGLEKIGKEGAKAFDTKRIKGFREAAKDLNSALATLVKTQAELTASVSKMDKGVRAYKDLKDELKSVRAELDAAKKATDGLNTSIERGAQRRQSFVAGLAQGAGVSQYIPTGPGMMPRIGGAMLGGAARRIGGGLSAPFLQPGMGGVAGALSAIPFVGPGLAGLLQQGYGYFQQATEFSKARLQNLPYADLESRGRLLTRMVPVTETTTKRGLTPKEATAAQKRVNAFAAKGDDSIEGMIASVDNEITQMKKIGAMKTTTRMVPKKDKSGRLIKYREDVTGIPTADFGASLGMAAEETQQWFGQMMQARGGKSSGEYLRGTVRQAMGIGKLFGVGAETVGGYERMSMPGGGGTGGVSLGETVGKAVAMGLEGSQIAEYLQTMVAQGRKAEAQGIKIDPGALSGAGVMMKALGMQGLQAPRVAGGLMEGARRVSATGVQKPMDLMWAMASGYDPSKPETYYTSQESLEEMRSTGKGGQGIVEKMLSQIASGARAGGGGVDTARERHRFKRAMAEAGVEISHKQAGAILGGIGTGGLTGEAATYAEMLGREKPENYLAKAQAGAGRIGGLAVKTAYNEARQIAIGGRLADTYLKLDGATRNAVDAMSAFAGPMAKLAGALEGVFKKIDTWAKTISLGDGT